MINRPLLSQASTARLSRTKRIDYIDLVKGIAIIGVVWSHTVHPQWYNVSYINALFFFLSGFFFKEEPFPVFFKKKIKTLIIPFTFFYLFLPYIIPLSYCSQFIGPSYPQQF